jgi:membrane fusion protein, heavy metal efflux system
VSKGDLLGVFYSLDVGSKKNDLLDALVQLELDQHILDNAQVHRQAVPEVFMLTAERAVQGDRNAVNRAINNLKLWEIPQDEIDALHAEAQKICSDKSAWFKTPEGRWVMREKQANGGKVDPHKEAENPWGRVTLRAPFDGVVVERNLSVDEMVVDNTVNLFQIADVRRLLVLANCPEDSLPTLEALSQNERRWTVQTVGANSVAGLPGTIDEIGYVIDPNQHTAIIKGYVDNPGRHIRAGQYVAATVQIPPPAGVVEIAVDALVDDGRQSLVFVQPDSGKHQFTMRRVHVTHRFDHTVFVRSTEFPKEEQLTALEAEEGLLPKEPIRPGDRVLLAGSVELKRVVLDLESRPQQKPTDLLAKAKTRPVSDLESQPQQKQKSRKG